MILSFSFSLLSLLRVCQPEGKLYSIFKDTYRALQQALNAIPRRSTVCLLARLNEPEPFVDASGDLREDVSGIGIIRLGCLRAGIARMFDKVGECLRKRLDVAVSICARKPMSVERRPVGDCTSRSLGPATKPHDMLGYQVRVSLHSFGDLVEQLAQGHEMRPFDIPVGLPTLQLQIDGVG